jgi:hypothetical protein
VVFERCVMMSIAAEIPPLCVIWLSLIDATRSFSLYRGNAYVSSAMR